MYRTKSIQSRKQGIYSYTTQTEFLYILLKVRDIGTSNVIVCWGLNYYNQYSMVFMSLIDRGILY